MKTQWEFSSNHSEGWVSGRKPARGTEVFLQADAPNFWLLKLSGPGSCVTVSLDDEALREFLCRAAALTTPPPIQYSVLVTRDEHGWTAYCPSLPHCRAWGKSQEDALQRCQEQLERTLGAMRRSGLPFPKPDHQWVNILLKFPDGKEPAGEPS